MTGPLPQFVLCLGLTACQESAATSRSALTTAPSERTAVAGYDLRRAAQSFTLPPVLREVSAITADGAHTIACVQDERGSLFIFDVGAGRVTAEVPFGPPGDYEGLARAGDDWWVLRSDGTLFEVRRKDDGLAVHATHALESGHKDWEGLALDRGGARLLLVPKDPPDGDKQDRDLRPVHVFDLSRKALEPRPLFVAHASSVVETAMKLGGLPREAAGKGKKILKLRFSEVAVHPDTGELWLLSAVDHALLVLDRTGGLRAIHVFPADEMPKAEALTFLPDGRLAIASEGTDGPAVLRLYGRAK